MSEDETTTISFRKEANIVWRTVTVVAVVVATCIGGIIYVAVEWTEMKSQIRSVEKWQENKDKQAAEDARRELWRRDRERLNQPGPPKS